MLSLKAGVGLCINPAYVVYIRMMGIPRCLLHRVTVTCFD